MNTLQENVKRSVDITVILCTYNRCESLANALSSIVKSVVPESLNWEVLVVDNSSTDRTREVLNEYASRYCDRLRYIFEPEPGLSNARNAGIREARGDVLAFVDDDVTVEPSWLHNLTAPLFGGEWAGSGGRIFPARDFVPPRWLGVDGPLNLLGSLCAQFDLGDSPAELSDAPHGTNMAFRKAMFEKYGGFRADLGRQPNSLISNEDTEFGRRLMAGGERLFYVPSAVVYHEIHAQRVRKEFFLAWWFDFGRSRIREIGIRRRVLGLPRHYISLPNNILRILPVKALRWLTTLNRQRRFQNKCLTWAAAGAIVEMWRQSEGTKGSGYMPSPGKTAGEA